MTTGQIDHKIVARLSFDELCAIIAIVSCVGDAEYALDKGVCPIDHGYFEDFCLGFTCNHRGLVIRG